ncbi:Type 1 glutamine amidotransferase-like domain-containing protein [Clostridium tertium]
MVNILLSKYSFNEDWAKNELKRYINSDDKVVIIPFAFNEKFISNNIEWQNAYNSDYGKYYREIVTPFMDFGIKENNIKWINYFEDSNEEIKKIIENSKIVFLTGGLPDRAVNRVMEKKLLNYIDDSKIIIGASAGALMQLKNYYISPDKDYSEFLHLSGLGLIDKDFYIEVHYEGTEIQNDCIKRILKEKTDTVYAIKDNGGIIIEDNAFLIIGDVITFNK